MNRSFTMRVKPEAIPASAIPEALDQLAAQIFPDLDTEARYYLRTPMDHYFTKVCQKADTLPDLDLAPIHRNIQQQLTNYAIQRGPASGLYAAEDTPPLQAVLEPKLDELLTTIENYATHVAKTNRAARTSLTFMGNGGAGS